MSPSFGIRRKKRRQPVTSPFKLLSTIIRRKEQSDQRCAFPCFPGSWPVTPGHYRNGNQGNATVPISHKRSRNRRVPLIPIPVVSRGNRSTSFVSKSQFFSPPKQQTRIFLPRVRGMSDKLVDKTVVLTEWTKTSWSFMNPTYPWILKQRIPTFGTVISVTDNDQDDAEMDYK